MPMAPHIDISGILLYNQLERYGESGIAMKTKSYTIFGDIAAKTLFLQLVDEHDSELMDSEAAALRELAGQGGWCIAAVPVANWNRDLTPWRGEPVFGKQGFGDGAPQTLANLLEQIIPSIEGKYPASERKIILCGYSLAGLFALWASYQTDRFAGIVAASPSVWYRDWLAYAEAHTIQTPRVYLSLGDREERAKKPVMASVGNAIREQYRMLQERGITCQLDWNPGNHFVDSDRRMARGMAWMFEAFNRK